MKHPNIRTYTNIPGEHNPGLKLQAYGEPYNPHVDIYDVQHVWLSGLREGYPGFERRNALSPEEIKNYLGLDRQPGKKGSPVHPRIVTVQSVREGQSEMTGLAIYGTTVTPAGVEARSRGVKVAHLPTFEVAAETRAGRRLQTEEMKAVGAALAHTLVADAIGQRFDEVSYKVEDVTKEEFDQKISDLGLSAKPVGYDPDFPVSVAHPLDMIRTEVFLDLVDTHQALERAEPWLGNVSVPPASSAFDILGDRS